MAKSKGPLTLPGPVEIDGDLYWDPVPRLSSTIPWGYKLDPENNEMLLPINEHLRVLEVVKKLTKKYSIRELADYLSEETGSYISHVGLAKRIETEQNRETKASYLLQVAKRYERAFINAQKAAKAANQFRPKERSKQIIGPNGVRGELAAFAGDYEPNKDSPGYTGTYSCCPTCGKRNYFPPQSGTTDPVSSGE